MVVMNKPYLVLYCQLLQNGDELAGTSSKVLTNPFLVSDHSPVAEFDDRFCSKRADTHLRVSLFLVVQLVHKVIRNECTAAGYRPVLVRREFQLLLAIEQLDEHLLASPIQRIKQLTEVRGVNVNKENHLNCECL